MSEAISQDWERCQLLFRLMKNAMLYRAERRRLVALAYALKEELSTSPT